MIETDDVAIDPWSEFLAAAEWDEPSIGAARIARWPEVALTEFERIGLLREASRDAALACAGCPDEQLREIMWIDHPVTGAKQAYLACPECGPCEIVTDDLRRWTVDWSQLVEFVQSGLQLRGASAELVPGRLWRLGKTYWSGRPVTLFLGRTLHRHDSTDVLARIDHFTSALILAPKRQPQTPSKHVLLSLDLVCGWNGEKLTFDAEFAASQLPHAASAEKPRRPKKDANRAAVKQRLRAELEAHLIAARDSAQTAIDFGREPTPLPFPTQEEWAKRCGTSKATINRCLRGDRELQAICAAAKDVYRLLGPGN